MDFKMKKLLIIPFFLLTFVGGDPALGKWKELTKNQRGDTLYVDFDRIKKHQGHVYYWYYIDYVRSSNGLLSVKLYNKGNCRNFRFRDLQSSKDARDFYKSRVAGTPNSPNTSSYWTIPIAGSEIETELNTICNLR